MAHFCLSFALIAGKVSKVEEFLINVQIYLHFQKNKSGDNFYQLLIKKIKHSNLRRQGQFSDCPPDGDKTLPLRTKADSAVFTCFFEFEPRFQVNVGCDEANGHPETASVS